MGNILHLVKSNSFEKGETIHKYGHNGFSQRRHSCELLKFSHETSLPSKPTSIFSLRSHKVWVFFREDSTLQLYKGTKRVKTVTLDTKLHNIDINLETEEAVGCALWNKKIRSINLKDGTTREMFTAEGLPEGILLTSDNNVVTYVPFGGDMHRRTYVICLFTKTGEKLKFFNKGKQFFHKTLQILQSPLTGRIAFLNGLEVTVLNKDLEYAYTFRGKDKVTAAVFDGQGHLFLAEFGKIHIVNESNGDIIQTMEHDHFQEVAAMAIQYNGQLKLAYGQGQKPFDHHRRSTYSGVPNKSKQESLSYVMVNVKFKHSAPEKAL